MSKSNDYKDGYQAGRNNFIANSSDSDYAQGYWNGKQEYDYWNDKDLYPSLRHNGEEHTKKTYNSLANDTPTLLGMIGGSVVLVILGWCFVGLILLLLWIGGKSGSWWFSWIWKVAFWGGVGFVTVVGSAGIILTILERWKQHSKRQKAVKKRQ